MTAQRAINVLCLYKEIQRETGGKLTDKPNQNKKIPRRWAGPDANFSKIFIKWVRID